jgi:hypothetical protein
VQPFGSSQHFMEPEGSLPSLQEPSNDTIRLIKYMGILQLSPAVNRIAFRASPLVAWHGLLKCRCSTATNRSRQVKMNLNNVLQSGNATPVLFPSLNL